MTCRPDESLEPVMEKEETDSETDNEKQHKAPSTWCNTSHCASSLTRLVIRSLMKLS